MADFLRKAAKPILVRIVPIFCGGILFSFSFRDELFKRQVLLYRWRMCFMDPDLQWGKEL